MSTWQRATLAGTYASAAIIIYLSNGLASAYTNWAAVGLIGLACWEFEPVLTTILDNTKTRVRPAPGRMTNIVANFNARRFRRKNPAPPDQTPPTGSPTPP